MSDPAKRSKKVAKSAKGNEKGSAPSKTKHVVAKPSENEKKLQEEIKKLKEKIVMLKCNHDPIKIMKELDLTDQSLINMLTEENLKLTDKLQKLENNIKPGDSGDATGSKHSNAKDSHKEIEKIKKENKELLAKVMQHEKDNARLINQVKEMENMAEAREKAIEKENSSLPEEDNGVVRLNQVKVEIDHLKSGVTDRQKSKGDQGVLQEKITELEILKKTTNELKKSIDEQNKTIIEQQKRIEAHIQTNGEHKTEIEKLTKELQDTKELKAKLQTAEQRLEDQVRNLKEEKASIGTEKKKAENELESLREQLRLKDRQVEDLKNTSANAEMSTKSADELKEKLDEITSLKNKLTSAESKIGSLESDKSDLKKKAEGQTKEKEEEIQRVKEEKKNLIDENKKLKDQTKEKESEIKRIKEDNMKTVDEKEKTIKKLRKEMDEANRSGKTNVGSSGLQDKLKSAQDEIDELKNRLSKVVGANIMNDNPNITDLSDENRPTKLSEKFSELYDNEWTDAFEEAENEFKTEEKGIDHLYKTLLDVFEFCKKKSEEHAQNIRNCVTTLPNSPNGRPKTADIGVTNHRQLKEIRKSFAPMLVDSVFQNYLKEKKLKLSKTDNTERFIRKCVEICWLMNSQDPPVILDTTVVTGKSFNSDKFRTYTKTGKAVDFVVWPPMLLHKDGPMLCKGVAQGK